MQYNFQNFVPVENEHIKNKLQKHVTELLQRSDVKHILLKLYFNTQPPVINANHKTAVFKLFFSEGKLYLTIPTLQSLKYALQNKKGKQLQPQRNYSIFDPVKTFLSASSIRTEGINRTVW